jgi:hypothetical protein
MPTEKCVDVQGSLPVTARPQNLLSDQWIQRKICPSSELWSTAEISLGSCAGSILKEIVFIRLSEDKQHNTGSGILRPN